MAKKRRLAPTKERVIVESFVHDAQRRSEAKELLSDVSVVYDRLRDFPRPENVKRVKTGLIKRDLNLPGARVLYDDTWGKEPTIHISRKQYRDWGRPGALERGLDGSPLLGSPVIPPFEVFCIAIDPHAGVPDWFDSVDLHGAPTRVRAEGMVVFCSDSIAFSGEETPKGRVGVVTLTRKQPDQTPREWFILERLRVESRDGGAHVDVTSVFRVDSETGKGEFLLTDPIIVDKEAPITSYGQKTMARVILLCHLLLERVWLPYDPHAAKNRAERRQAEREAKRLGHDAEHYRIFLRRKKRLPNPDAEPGTGEPKAYQERVRAHLRRYKSGRIVTVHEHVRCKDKPPRPGGPAQYDAWGIDADEA